MNLRRHRPAQQVTTVAKSASLKKLNTPEPRDMLIARLLTEARGNTSEVAIGAALEFRREQYNLTQDEFAFILGVRPSHYSEVVRGRREITKKMMRRAFAIGVPAAVLLQPVTVRAEHE
jgi:DNA-binding transcriptional regulator YiaG